MLKNYFKIAIRQLRKQKMYSAIKIGGFEQGSRGSGNYPIYLLLRPGINLAQFEKKLTADLLKNYFIPKKL